ncbi:DUF5710 domain-containing protein, partial [Ralstonia thomasii]|uniref:DUF5710 domain-containing protein n=1 Tax=Ralstonia thomasii TaxID=3058596 RepID=UPI003C2D6039
ARDLGAEWAKEAQTWYVPPGVDADKLAKFAPHTPFEQWEANGRQHAAQAVNGPAMDPEQAARDARLHYDQRAMSRNSTPQENAKNREAWKIAEGQAMLHELEAREKAVERGQDSAPVQEPAAESERAKRRPLREPDLAKGDVILAVPYKDRAEAGRLGAEWAQEAKTWYVPAGVEQGPLQKWLPKGHDVAQGVAQDPHAAFGAELRAFGLVIDGEPIMDGKLHRVPLVDGKPKGRDGAYVGHLDGRPAGYMQNFVTGEKRNWKLDGPELSAEQKAELAAQAAIAKQRRAAELNSQHEAAAKRAQERWDRAEEMPRGTTTPYLDRKQVPALGVRREGANMLVPARDINGKLWSVQTIFPQKKELEPGTEPLDKVFTKGARKEGNFHMLGSVREGEPILVMEGYATGASANMATGYAVAVAFDSGNLEAVTGALKEKYPTNAIFIGADDDRFQKPGREFRNAGLQKAIEAAYQHDVGVIVPMFSTDGKLTDFNDLHVTEGLTEVKEQIHRGIAVTMEQSRKEAERIVAQQLGEQAPVRTPGPNTRHTGEVLGVTGYHVAQHTGRDGTVHRTQDLDRRPEAGTVATVQYKGGRGKVTDKTQEQQKEKSISR